MYQEKDNFRHNLSANIENYEAVFFVDNIQNYNETKNLFHDIYSSFYNTDIFKENYTNDNKNVFEIYREECWKEVKYCPYCRIEKIKKIGCEIDHFIPISKNPLYGFTTYNLVISCNDCNSVYKKSELVCPIFSPNLTNIYDYCKFFLEKDGKIKIKSLDPQYEEHVVNFFL